MNFDEPPRPYPIGAFYVAVKDAVKEVWRNTQAPDALVGMEFLASMSVAAQGLYDVKLPTGQCSPLSLYVAGVADSGERKTAVYNLVVAPIIDYDLERMKEHQINVQQYEQQKSVWETTEAGLRRRLKKLTQDGDSTEDASQQLFEHMAQKPVTPSLHRIMRENVTPRALMEALEGDGRSIAIMSDEAEIIVKGGALNQLGLINKCWGGPSMLPLDRSNGVKIVARNPRVTFSYKVQSQVLEKLLERRGDSLRGSGHWARYLVGWPETTQGMRHTDGFEQEWRHLPKFHDRMRELLNEYRQRVDAGEVRREVLEFSEDANRRWIQLTNSTEDMLNPNGPMYDIKDFASKGLEIAARIAALFHVFSNQEGKISEESVSRAMQIVDWHLGEARRIFSPTKIPEALRDAQVLEAYLFDYYWRRGFNFAQKNLVLRKGPIRPVSRLNAALEFLIEKRRVWFSNGSKRECLINLDPDYFDSLFVRRRF